MAIFPNLCFPAGRDLRFASTGSNYNPRNTLKCIPVVIIFAFLDLGDNLSFSDTLKVKRSGGRPTFYRLPSHL
jgi:hypothetical protein